MLRKILINTRKTVKITILFGIAIILGIGLVALLFKPTYKVKINGEEVGYTENKSELQKQINAYIEKGDGSNDNIAFVQVEDLPQYEICLLKKDITTNDEEIVETIKNRGVTYYRYYAILENSGELSVIEKSNTAGQNKNSERGLQTSLVINKNSDDYTRLIIDTENYREKRKKTLEDLADKIKNYQDWYFK